MRSVHYHQSYFSCCLNCRPKPHQASNHNATPAITTAKNSPTSCFTPMLATGPAYCVGLEPSPLRITFPRLTVLVPMTAVAPPLARLIGVPEIVMPGPPGTSVCDP